MNFVALSSKGKGVKLFLNPIEITLKRSKGQGLYQGWLRLFRDAARVGTALNDKKKESVCSPCFCYTIFV